MLEFKTPHTLHFMDFLEYKGARTHAKPRLGCSPSDPRTSVPLWSARHRSQTWEILTDAPRCAHKTGLSFLEKSTTFNMSE